VIDLPLDEKVGQMLFAGFHGTSAPRNIIEWLKEGKMGGVILFARNIESPEQVEALTRSLHTAAKHPILIAIDQEGGTVARLRAGYTESPGAMALGAADDSALTERVSGVLATELRALGINWNLAPAIDLTHNIHNPSVGTRSLGADPGHVAKHAVAQIMGSQSKGVAATAKHFPGKANTPVDPHVELPVIEGKLEEMWETDLVPFRAASNAGISAVMITHVQFKDIEPNYPSTLSPKIIQGLLREKIGYNGLVTTDCMEIKAITNKYGPDESAVLAAKAGANTILFSHTREYQEEVYESLFKAAQSGRLPIEQIDYSVQRIFEVKQRYPAYPKPSVSVIRKHEHLETMLEAARAGTVMLRQDSDIVPLESSRKTVLIEFASHIEKETLGEDSETILAGLLKKRLPGLRSIWLDPVSPSQKHLEKANQITEEAVITIVATRNAHLSPNQRDTAMRHLDRSSTLLCLRNPYDAGVLEAGVMILTLGDSTPSLQVATEVLMGDFNPSAKLRVPLTMKNAS
jgi:beta-N-acetylhexosaminidase